MAKKSRRGVKTYRPYGPMVFLYALLALAVVACLGGFAFLPMFTFYQEGEAPIIFKGYEFILFTIRRFFGDTISSIGNLKNNIDAFLAFFTASTPEAAPDNQLLKIIFNTHEYIELAIGGVIALAGVWALVLVLLSLGFMIFGQSPHTKSLDIFAWLTFWFFAVGLGLSYMYFFFYQQIIADRATINLSLQVVFVIGAMFAACLGVLIIYVTSFKNRVPFNGKKDKNKAAVIEDGGSSSQPQKAQIVSEQAPSNTWKCPKCGSEVSGKFCPECGEKKPEPQSGWICPNCGAQATGKYCPECGNKKPEAEPIKQESAPVIEQPAIEEKKEAPAPAPVPAPIGADVITVGDHAYAKNTELTSAIIPEGIVSLGSSAFANCVNLASVSIPSSLQEIGFNCFFNTPKLVDISYNGTVEQWKAIKRGSNWLTKSGTKTVQCLDGQINVNPRH